MKYKIVRENKPTLKNYGRYKAVAMHFQTITPDMVAKEIQDNCSAKASDVELVLTDAPSKGWRPCAAETYRPAEAGDREREGGCARRFRQPEVYPRRAPSPVAREPKGPPGGL